MTEFTHESYLKLLADIQSMGRKFVGFDTVTPEDDNYVILRHDVDFSLPKAVEIAKLDRQAGVSSTFFVLLTAPYYNALSYDGVNCIHEIAAMGHKIGLHYDASGYEDLTEQQRLNRVRMRADMLQDAIGMPITMIAQHKPGKSTVKQVFPDFIDAYSPQFFKDIAYMSDSRRLFLTSDLLDFFRNHSRAQLLLHPLWWNKVNMTRAEILADMLKRSNDYISGHLQSELDTMDAHLAKLGLL